MRLGRRRATDAGFIALACLALWPDMAAAVLGEPAASIQADGLRLAATRRIAGALNLQVHTLTLADGSAIREYVGPDGRVCAIAWNMHAKPRLDQLLGRHFAAFAASAALRQATQPGARHSTVLDDGELVVEAGAHLQAHVGRAYLRSKLPAGTTRDAIR